MSFNLLSDRIAVIAEEAPIETTTASGLVIPDGASESVLKAIYGDVKFVGCGHRSEHTGELVEMDVKVGDRVFFHPSSGEKWEFEGAEYRVLAPSQVIGIDTSDEN